MANEENSIFGYIFYYYDNYTLYFPRRGCVSFVTKKSRKNDCRLCISLGGLCLDCPSGCLGYPSGLEFVPRKKRTIVPKFQAEFEHGPYRLTPSSTSSKISKILTLQ